MVKQNLVAVPYDHAGAQAFIRMNDCDGRDQVVRQIKAAGWRSYESPLPLVLSQLIKAAKQASPVAFFDVGANTGYYSILAALAGSLDVRAFEPVPQIAEILRANLLASLGPLHRPVRLFELALSDHTERGILYIPNQAHGLVETSASLNPEFREMHSGRIEIQVQRLDEHIAEHPLASNVQLIIKLDVESFEPQVLKGADRLIRQNKPWIVSEILPGADLEFYQDWMLNLGYAHFDLLPPNQVLPDASIKPRLDCRDHLFLPEGLDCQTLLNS